MIASSSETAALLEKEAFFFCHARNAPVVRIPRGAACLFSTYFRASGASCGRPRNQSPSIPELCIPNLIPRRSKRHLSPKRSKRMGEANCSRTCFAGSKETLHQILSLPPERPLDQHRKANTQEAKTMGLLQNADSATTPNILMGNYIFRLCAREAPAASYQSCTDARISA